MPGQQDPKPVGRAEQGPRARLLEHSAHPGIRPALLEDAARMPGKPLVREDLHQDKRPVVLLAEIHLDRFRLAEAHLEDAPIRAVVGARVDEMALVLVVPVDHEEAAVRPTLEADDLRPDVVGQQEVGGVRADETRAALRQDVAVDPGPVDIVHEQRAVVDRGPGATQVDHRAGVRMAAPGGIGAAVAPVRVRARVVPVIGDRLDVVIGVGIEVLARLPLEPSALDHVIEMRDHAGGDDHLAARVEVDSPGVAGALGKHLEDMPDRVVAPDARIDRSAESTRGAGFADQGVGEDAVAAIKPAVGPPNEAIERLVGIVQSPAVEQDLGRTVGAVVAVPVRYEEKLRGRADPGASETDLEAADQVQVVGEDLAPVESAVTIGILEDEDAVPGLAIGDAPRVRVGLGDPDTASVVDRHRDRLDDVGLAGEERDLEAGWNGHRPCRLPGREPGVGVSVERRGAPPPRHGRRHIVQPEIVEIDVPPALARSIHQPDHNVPAHLLREVHHHAFEVLAIVPRHPKDDLARIVPEELNACRRL